MPLKSPFGSLTAGKLWLVGLGVCLVAGAVTFQNWWPQTQAWVRNTVAMQRQGSSGPEGEAGHLDAKADHPHDEANSLELSPQAMANIGLSAEALRPIQLETYRRTITIPAMVVERPGRTRIQVSTPMAGVITHVHAVRGEAIRPGTLLFELRITADELVSTQTELLKTVGDLDVENREIARLEDGTRSGAIPPKTMLDRQYAKGKLEVLLAAQKEALRLQGLSDRQIQDIIEHRRLLRDLRIYVPSPDRHNHDELNLTMNDVAAVVQTDAADQTTEELPAAEHSEADQSDSTLLVLQEVPVHKGERVAAGAMLAVLSDMSELYIEGRAFEQDSDLLADASAKHWKVSAAFERAGQEAVVVPELDLLYSASDVDVLSRTLRFYVRLPNEISRNVPSPNGLRFIEWKYRPGQRLQLKVPVEEWSEQIVVPVDAIAQEGAESFVFQQNGRHFDRVPVHVVYRDQVHAVIKNDGAVFAGDVIARRGAHQLQMALKNKSGTGADPHAGHTH